MYNCTLGTQAKKIISLASEDLFIEIEEIFRILTVDEIINMSRDFGSKLIPQKLVPLIDNGDNIFICYDANVHKFCKYNLADDKKIKEFEDITKYRP